MDFETRVDVSGLLVAPAAILGRVYKTDRISEVTMVTIHLEDIASLVEDLTFSFCLR